MTHFSDSLYDPAQNLARRTNNAAGSTVSATVNALNQLTAGLGFSGSLGYDRRGNLTSIGSAGSGKAFAYDHENQCVTAGGFNAYNKSDFVYDGKGRLRKRTDYQWNGSSWTPTGETRYVYDGMLLIQERTSAGHPAVTYTRGLDLSGSLAGAGGIGGLLARTVHQSTSPYQPASHAYYHADGNGNVTYLLRQDRTHGASYKYDPYGRLIASSGPLSSANLLRFSSKPWHDHSETYYYGYRFYLPEGQRRINRDPIGEEGGFNLYAFTSNNSVNSVDSYGLASVAGPGGHLGGFSGPFNTFWRRNGGGIAGLLGAAVGYAAGKYMESCPKDCERAECESCCAKGAALGAAGVAVVGVAGSIGTGGFGIGLSAAGALLGAAQVYDAYKACMEACKALN